MQEILNSDMLVEDENSDIDNEDVMIPQITGITSKNELEPNISQEDEIFTTRKETQIESVPAFIEQEETKPI